jgi:hypothetical protein
MRKAIIIGLIFLKLGFTIGGAWLMGALAVQTNAKGIDLIGMAITGGLFVGIIARLLFDGWLYKMVGYQE